MRKLLPTVALLTVLGGCGWTVSGAREAYAQKWCNYYVRCQEVGSGKYYSTTDDCLIAERNVALNLWPTSDCEGKISSQGLDICLSAIDNTQCNNLIDQALTATKCLKNSICL